MTWIRDSGRRIILPLPVRTESDIASFWIARPTDSLICLPSSALHSSALVSMNHRLNFKPSFTIRLNRYFETRTFLTILFVRMRWFQTRPIWPRTIPQVSAANTPSTMLPLHRANVTMITKWEKRLWKDDKRLILFNDEFVFRTFWILLEGRKLRTNSKEWVEIIS